eukprot:TRINITY_DN22425_c0_g1_i1.p1 TRINITY_DN22425_c0_g1~~TRINITY_DN22425_c0_g1_i1.p1  ORF type:complete len:421 (-),score=54.63 TRINITY_DN22425_c0_g1_i1:126-1388(-)
MFEMFPGRLLGNNISWIPLPPDCVILPSKDNRTNQIAAEKIRILSKPTCESKYNVCKDYMDSQLGMRLKPSLNRRICVSSCVIANIALESRLPGHTKGVNSLHFSSSGGDLVSCSDDLNVIIWDWQKKQKRLTFKTDHEIIVTQAKILPGGLNVVTSCYDGQIRHKHLRPSGDSLCSVLLLQHRGSVHKISLVSDSPTLVLTAGEDGQIFAVDLRNQKPVKLTLLENRKGIKVPIYSIQSNPGNGQQFCVTGRDQHLRIYDLRLMKNQQPLSSFCPSDLVHCDMETNPNSAVFSKNGSEILISYDFLGHTDKNIYLWNTSSPSFSPPQHIYKSYRDSPTINFYGENSEFILAGSNDAYAGVNSGDIFFWSKEGEGVVKVVPGDSHGIVRSVEVHPTLPVVASSGVDNDVKIWSPYGDKFV